MLSRLLTSLPAPAAGAVAGGRRAYARRSASGVCACFALGTACTFARAPPGVRACGRLTHCRSMVTGLRARLRLFAPTCPAKCPALLASTVVQFVSFAENGVSVPVAVAERVVLSAAPSEAGLSPVAKPAEAGGKCPSVSSSRALPASCCAACSGSRPVVAGRTCSDTWARRRGLEQRGADVLLSNRPLCHVAVLLASLLPRPVRLSRSECQSAGSNIAGSSVPVAVQHAAAALPVLCECPALLAAAPGCAASSR